LVCEHELMSMFAYCLSVMFEIVVLAFGTFL
jgi:hypothetical protein